MEKYQIDDPQFKAIIRAEKISVGQIDLVMSIIFQYLASNWYGIKALFTIKFILYHIWKVRTTDFFHVQLDGQDYSDTNVEFIIINYGVNYEITSKISDIVFNS